MSEVRFEPLGLNKAELLKRMGEAGLDGVLLTSPENVFYTTGYPALPSSGNPILYALRNVLPFFSYVSARGKTTLLCWGGAATGVTYGVDAVKTFPDIAGAYQELASVLSADLTSSSRLGIESSCPYAVLQVAGQIVQPQHLVTVDRAMMLTRMVKSSQEVALLEKSIQVVEQTVSELMDMVHLGVDRPSLMQAAKVGMMRRGASGISHVTLSFGASNPEVEVYEKLQSGKLVTLDLGAIVSGYYSDTRRLMFSGEIPSGMSALHQTMCAIVDEVGGALAPGKTFGEVYDLAMALYDRQGLKPFIPNIGHTIGLQVEEIWLYPENAALVLEAGIVLNLEMYAVYETGELIGDEETYVIAESGVRQLTHLPTPIRPVTTSGIFRTLGA
ncbi:MAG: aminopeptidase P family protein [Anaerolineae bacterium]|nr:aminopeptidase P family protein [Anaerolineae bacterium]